MSTDLLTDESCGLRERKKRETRRALNLAALDLVEEKGFAAVTTEEIAARAGVSARTFFNYFPSKEAAVIGTTAEELEAYAASLEEDAGDESPLDSLRRILAGMLAPTSIDRELRAKRRRILLGEPSLAPGPRRQQHPHRERPDGGARAPPRRPGRGLARAAPHRGRRHRGRARLHRAPAERRLRAVWSATSTRPSTASRPACAEHRPRRRVPSAPRPLSDGSAQRRRAAAAWAMQVRAAGRARSRSSGIRSPHTSQRP